MKKTDEKTLEALRAHAREYPEDSYKQIAATFGVSVITVKRHCSDLGRGKNWRRGRKETSPNADKFWAAVERHVENGCWPWKGCLNNSGYGFVHFNGRSQATHRLAYSLLRETIPDDAELDHLCRNRACCNPDHLEPVTHAENMERIRQSEPQGNQPWSDGSLGQIGTPSSIDTGESRGTSPAIKRTVTIINESRLHRNDKNPGRVSVSISPVPVGFHDPLVAGHNEYRERMTKLEAENKRWGLDLPTLRRTPGAATQFRIFQITPCREIGFLVFLYARSAQDAAEMFTSVWGTGYSVHPGEVGSMSFESGIRAIGKWRDDLKARLEEFRATPEGERCLERVRAENQEKWIAQLHEEDAERALRRYEDAWEEEESRLQRLATRSPKARHIRRGHTTRRQAWEFDPEELASEETEELDY